MIQPGPDHELQRSKLRVSDSLRSGIHGLRSRRGRTALTAIGIAIGIASLVSVVGLSASSKADLVAQIDALGTNLLRVEAGRSALGDKAALPREAPAMVRRIGPITHAASVTGLNTSVNRNIYADGYNGLAVLATEPELAATIDAELLTGRFLDSQTARLPTAVLGSVAAERLGVRSLRGLPTVEIASHLFAVIGILKPSPLNPEIERSVMIGNQAAEDFLDADVVPTSIYVRTLPEFVIDVREVLARTANPRRPNEIGVSRPSDAFEARAQVDQNLQRLLLGLGTVALLVGGLGIANVMIISVLERRSEIGLRRALGATRTHIATQFILESATLSALGGIAGSALGTLVTAAYARQQDWLFEMPISGLAVAVLTALGVGALAGVYPAARAANLDPANSLRPV